MAIGSWDVLSPFEPPHLDSVTGLTVVGGRLVSGSKDKHLRLWALDHAVNNSKHTFYAFNDYVTTVQGNRKSKIGVPNAPLFYAGSKDGQVKACYVKNDRI
jgi:WD40 repeat protein